MRVYEVKLENGQTVTVKAGDSYEAICFAQSQMRGKVVGIRWVA